MNKINYQIVNKQTYDDPSGSIMTLPNMSFCPEVSISASSVELGANVVEGDTLGFTKL